MLAIVRRTVVLLLVALVLVDLVSDPPSPLPPAAADADELSTEPGIYPIALEYRKQLVEGIEAFGPGDGAGQVVALAPVACDSPWAWLTHLSLSLPRPHSLYVFMSLRR